MKLTEENKQEIRNLFNQGKNKLEISRIIGATPRTITYWLCSNEERKEIIKKNCDFFRNLSKKRRQEVYKRRLPYIRNYLKKKYNSDKEFRLKQIIRVQEYRKSKMKKKDI